MKSYTTEAIAIRHIDLGEADRRITFFTERFGKIVAIAKGARRPKSKFSAGTDLFCRSRCHFVRGKTFDILTEVEILNSHCLILDSLDNVKNAYWMGELVDKSVHEREPNTELYNLLSGTLVEINGFKNRLLLDCFIMNWLMHLGYKPELYRCTVTSSEIKKSDAIYFSPSDGGVICKPGNKSGRLINTGVLKVLRYLLNDWRLVKNLNVPNNISSQVHLCVTDFTQWVLEKEIKSDKI